MSNGLASSRCVTAALVAFFLLASTNLHAQPNFLVILGDDMDVETLDM
jgi:hypothetical protein